jgi:mono/diheme cytochrome c family protein
MRSVGNDIKQVGLFGGVAFAVALGGCNSFEPKPTSSSSAGHLVIPVDERAAAAPPVAMRPITGGTLSLLADGVTAIAADPERDQVSIVDLSSLTVRTVIPLEAGDEPGRSVEDADKRVHLSLRGGGALVTIDPVGGTILERRAVCKAPRGLVFDPSSKLLHVACTEGKLVSLPAAGGAAVRSVTLEPDLRDVILRGTELWVSTFKSARLLRVSANDGTLHDRVVIPQSRGLLNQPSVVSEEFGPSSGSLKDVAVDPAVAWRTVGSPSGGAVIVHQHAVADEIEIPAPSTSGSAYGGGGFDCSGIVKNAVTTVAPDGTTVSASIAGVPLPVDVAVSPDQQWVAVAHAGPPDFEAPRPFIEFPDEGDSPGLSGGGPGIAGGTLTIHSTANLQPGQTCAFPEGMPTQDTVTAVAFAANGKLIAQVQEPPRVLVIDNVQFGPIATIELPGSARADTGHDLFHRDSGGGIACASCHPEGGEDGRTWRFADTGDRRTQPLNVGLEGTAPFHWAGDLPDVSSLMSEVFVQRMGGVRQSPERLAALTKWLFALEPLPAIRDAVDEQAVRGQELFNSPEVGCATCHSGDKLTNNATVAIDSLVPAKTQVPSLIGIGYRAPFMHTGCAATLVGRFDPACGGNAHGNTAQLSPAELGELVAYLESL